jgi:hypothetical protein
MVDLFKKKQADHSLYEIAGKEIVSKELHKGSWSRAIEKADGNTHKVEGYYVSFRVAYLKDRQDGYTNLKEVLAGSTKVRLNDEENYILSLIRKLEVIGYSVSLIGVLYREYIVTGPNNMIEQCASDEDFFSCANAQIKEHEKKLYAEKLKRDEKAHTQRVADQNHKMLINRLYEEHDIFTVKGRHSSIGELWTLEVKRKMVVFKVYQDFLDYANKILD